MTKTKSLAPPRHLGKEAAAIWRQVAAYLAGNGRLEAVDAGTIETYALAMVRQRRLTAALDRAELVDKDGKPHPLLRTIEATAATVKNLGHVLGLNPTARRALPSKPAKARATGGGDVWHGVLE